MRAYMRTRARATHFSGIGFSGNRQGSNPPPVDRGRLKFFPENGWTGAGLRAISDLSRLLMNFFSITNVNNKVSV